VNGGTPRKAQKASTFSGQNSDPEEPGIIAERKRGKTSQPTKKTTSNAEPKVLKKHKIIIKYLKKSKKKKKMSSFMKFYFLRLRLLC
jgi:hypothetical protein